MTFFRNMATIVGFVLQSIVQSPTWLTAVGTTALAWAGYIENVQTAFLAAVAIGVQAWREKLGEQAGATRILGRHYAQLREEEAENNPLFQMLRDAVDAEEGSEEGGGYL